MFYLPDVHRMYIRQTHGLHYALKIAVALDEIFAYEPEHLIAGHGLPVSGKDTIQKEKGLLH